MSWQGTARRWRVASSKREPLHAEHALAEEPHLVVAALVVAGGRALAADLDLAAARVDLEDLERLHEVSHPAGEPRRPSR